MCYTMQILIKAECITTEKKSFVQHHENDGSLRSIINIVYLSLASISWALNKRRPVVAMPLNSSFFLQNQFSAIV